MIEPMVSMAFAVYSNKGIYALLLGSGVSRASGIPTGWEIVRDLIRKVAAASGEDCEPDPDGWYRAKFSAEPDYSALLDMIAKTPAGRQQLLRAYFEPSEEERAEGLKLPTHAHKAIAKLVAAGYFRVIITTNFDRLTERALEEIGITPTVISNTDQILGALPLVHSGPTVIKLHGDYIDTRIKNTQTELSSYADPLNALLDQVIDEYGLIISGWSGDWDIALRAAIERCSSRRFATFWTARSEPIGQAKVLLEHRRAQFVQVVDANQLFTALSEKVHALQDLGNHHPLSAEIAVATMKRYLVEPTARIRLRDLIHEETENVFLTFDNNSHNTHGNLSFAAVSDRLAHYESTCKILLPMMIVGCYWSNERGLSPWINCLQRISSPPQHTTGHPDLLNLRMYPALLLLYGSGMAAMVQANYNLLHELLFRPKVKMRGARHEPICHKLHPRSLLSAELIRYTREFSSKCTPVSDRLSETLREYFRDLVSSDEDFLALFDRFEYLLNLVYADGVRFDGKEGGWWGPIGRFHWREGSIPSEERASFMLRNLIAEPNSPLLEAGFFGGALIRANSAIAKFEEFLSTVRW